LQDLNVMKIRRKQYINSKYYYVLILQVVLGMILATDFNTVASHNKISRWKAQLFHSIYECGDLE
jgi:hypothetical protein